MHGMTDYLVFLSDMALYFRRYMIKQGKRPQGFGRQG
jgi:hypothetical protein